MVPNTGFFGVPRAAFTRLGWNRECIVRKLVDSHSHLVDVRPHLAVS